MLPLTGPPHTRSCVARCAQWCKPLHTQRTSVRPRRGPRRATASGCSPPLSLFRSHASQHLAHARRTSARVQQPSFSRPSHSRLVRVPACSSYPSYSRTRTARSPSWSDSISSGHAHNRPQEPAASHPWPSLPRTHVHGCSPALAPPPTCTRWRQRVTRHLRATRAEPPPHALRLRACVFTCTTGSRPSDRRPFPPYMPCAPAQHLHLTAPAHLSALPSLAVHQNAPASHGVAHSARTAAAHKDPQRTDVKRW